MKCKMFKRIALGIIAVMGFCFCGCEPEETYVLIETSEIEKAINGELGFATIEMVFEINSDDASVPNRVRSAALPYLGEGAVIEIQKKVVTTTADVGSIRETKEKDSNESLDDAKLIARFKIPMGTKEVLRKVDCDVMRLEYNPSNNMFMLVPGTSVAALNSDLNDIDYSIDFKYTGGNVSFSSGTTIKIQGKDPLKVTVCAVKVNDNNVLLDTFNTAEGPLSINYANNFYSGYAPCFIVGDFKGEFETKKLKKDSSY